MGFLYIMLRRGRRWSFSETVWDLERSLQNRSRNFPEPKFILLSQGESRSLFWKQSMESARSLLRRQERSLKKQRRCFRRSIMRCCFRWQIILRWQRRERRRTVRFQIHLHRISVCCLERSIKWPWKGGRSSGGWPDMRSQRMKSDSSRCISMPGFQMRQYPRLWIRPES